jgi:hypothetical protein
MIEVEKIADNRYRLRAHGQLMTVSAQDLVDFYDYLRVGARLDNLRAEARTDSAVGNREKAYLPIQPGQEDF